MAQRVYLTVAEVLAIHHRQIETYGGSHGLRDIGALEAAVFRPQTGYYNNLAEEAAALMESLANNHPFLDGNKLALGRGDANSVAVGPSYALAGETRDLADSSVGSVVNAHTVTESVMSKRLSWRITTGRGFPA